MRIVGPYPMPGFNPAGGAGVFGRLAVLEGPARRCACDGLSMYAPPPTDGGGGGYGGDGVTPTSTVNPLTTAIPGAPPGYTDWTAIGKDLTTKLNAEPDKAKQQAIATTLSVAGAAVGIPVVGWVVAGATAVLALFGITFRGATQHVDTLTAANAAYTFVRNRIIPMYQKLPADAKQYFAQLAANLDAAMVNMFGPQWGGAPIRDRGGLATGITAEYFLSLGDMSSYMNSDSWPFVMWLYDIMRYDDMATVDENLKAQYFGNVESYVLKPLDKFMLDKYNKTVAQFEAAGVDTGIGKLVAGISTPVLAGLGIAGLLGAIAYARR